MKVIKKGRQQTGWAKESVCTGKGNGGGGCGAVLLVEKDDLYQTSRGDYLGDYEHYTTFCCSDCAVETDIESPFSPHALPTKRVWQQAHGKQEE